MGRNTPPFPPDSIDGLFWDICVDFGFCLPPDGYERIRANPPETVVDFVDAVYLEEGLAGDKRQPLRQAVEDRVAKYFDAKDKD